MCVCVCMDTVYFCISVECEYMYTSTHACTLYVIIHVVKCTKLHVHVLHALCPPLTEQCASGHPRD